MIKISGAVVFYKPDEEVKENILSYLDNLDHLYVIDNTPNMSNEKLLPKSKKIEYIPLNENKGVSYALNVAAKKSIEKGYKWMMTMDQDSKFKKGELDKMIDFINNNKDSKIGLICPWHVIATNPTKPEEDIDLDISIDGEEDLEDEDKY